MRYVLAAILAIGVAGTALAESKTTDGADGPAAIQVANNPDPELVSLYANQLFLELCVAPQPQLSNVSAAIESQSYEELPADIVELGVATLGLDQALDNVQLGERSFSGNIFISEDFSTAGAVVNAESIHGTVELVGQPGSLTVCSIGMWGVPAIELVRSIATLLQRNPESEAVADLDAGGKTRWVMWNTSGSSSGVVVLAVLIPEEEGSEGYLHRLMAIGLE